MNAKKKRKKKEKGGRGRRRKKIEGLIFKDFTEIFVRLHLTQAQFSEMQLLDWMSNHELTSNHCRYHITKLHFSVFFSFRRHCEVVSCDCFSWIDKKIIIFARRKDME